MTPDSNELLARVEAGEKADAMHALDLLIKFAYAAWDAVDNAEERNGEEFIVIDEHFGKRVHAALEALEELPDDQPGYLMGPIAKVQWALRSLSAPAERALVDAEIARANEQDAAISASESAFMDELRRRQTIPSDDVRSALADLPFLWERRANSLRNRTQAALDDSELGEAGGVADGLLEAAKDLRGALRSAPVSGPAVGVTREAMRERYARAICESDSRDYDKERELAQKFESASAREIVNRAHRYAEAILALSPVPDATVPEPVWLIPDTAPAPCSCCGGEMHLNAANFSCDQQTSETFHTHDLPGAILRPHIPQHVDREATVSARDGVIEQPGFDFYECKVCGFSSVQPADFKGSDECPICAGDCGHSNTMSCRTARSTDKPEGNDARSLASGAKP